MTRAELSNLEQATHVIQSKRGYVADLDLPIQIDLDWFTNHMRIPNEVVKSIAKLSKEVCGSLWAIPINIQTVSLVSDNIEEEGFLRAVRVSKTWTERDSVDGSQVTFAPLSSNEVLDEVLVRVRDDNMIY